jgi:hypothetical protein
MEANRRFGPESNEQDTAHKRPNVHVYGSRDTKKEAQSCSITIAGDEREDGGQTFSNRKKKLDTRQSSTDLVDS